MGLAGLRLGILIGRPAWIEQIDKIRLPYNINSLTRISAEFVLQHWDILLQQTKVIIEQREWVFAHLSQIKNIKVYKSEANFILFKIPNCAEKIFNALKQQRILIKRMSPQGLLIDCLRVTIGTPAENEKFISALKLIMLNGDPYGAAIS